MPAGSGSSSHAEPLVPIAPREKPQRLGVCWDTTEPLVNWQGYLMTYLFFVEGAEKQSSKFTVERVGGRCLVKATGCDGESLSGHQHKVNPLLVQSHSSQGGRSEK